MELIGEYVANIVIMEKKQELNKCIQNLRFFELRRALQDTNFAGHIFDGSKTNNQ